MAKTTWGVEVYYEHDQHARHAENPQVRCVACVIDARDRGDDEFLRRVMARIGVRADGPRLTLAECIERVSEALR
jgi:hypothetical protein